jgi:hypothetical protein
MAQQTGAPSTPPCQPVGAARLALAPALGTRAPEAGCEVWGWGRAFRRAGCWVVGLSPMAYGPNDQVNRVSAPAAAGNSRWLQSPKSVEVEVTCHLIGYWKEVPGIKTGERACAPLFACLPSIGGRGAGGCPCPLRADWDPLMSKGSGMLWGNTRRHQKEQSSSEIRTMHALCGNHGRSQERNTSCV